MKISPAVRRLIDAFWRVRNFVSKKNGHLEHVILDITCPKVLALRKIRGEGRRLFAHASCNGRICVNPLLGKQSMPYLIGVLLHEFGHIAGGPEEGDADMWVLTTFGIPIIYKGPLFLEWLDPKLIREKGI